MINRPVFLALGLIGFGCNSGKVILDRVYEDFDGRFVSQVYTWECQATNDASTETFVGTFGHEVALYYAPSSLDDLFPKSGCVYGLDMFPTTAGENGSSLEGLVGYPSWSNGIDNGVLEGGFGYWFQDILTDERTCTSPEVILNAPMVLDNALGLSGASIETAYDVPTVNFDSGVTSLDFGEVISMQWGNHDWPRTWVHIRRVQEGVPVELITCAVDNNEFTLGTEIWDQFNEAFPADSVEIYVGFEAREVQQLSSGDVVEVLNRAVAVPVEN